MHTFQALNLVNENGNDKSQMDKENELPNKFQGAMFAMKQRQVNLEMPVPLPERISFNSVSTFT